jgi:hypothetical protein
MRELLRIIVVGFDAMDRTLSSNFAFVRLWRERESGGGGEGEKERNTEVLLDDCKEPTLKYDTHVKEEKCKQRFDRKI